MDDLLSIYRVEWDIMMDNTNGELMKGWMNEHVALRLIHHSIVICCDNIHSEKQLESTLVHELVHAFDRIRTGTFSTMCHLIACGEIRASALGKKKAYSIDVLIHMMSCMYVHRTMS